jgi:hypothetical protein
MTFDTPQLGVTERSPITPIEHQEDALGRRLGSGSRRR